MTFVGGEILKTIKMIAGEIGTTKQALQKRMAREPLYTRLFTHVSMQDGTKYIDDTGEAILKAAFAIKTSMDVGIDVTDVSIDMGMDNGERGVDTTIDKDENGMDVSIDTKRGHVDALLEIISEQQQTIKDLTAANRELTSALENTTASLKAGQALHAGTMHTQLLTDKKVSRDISEGSGNDLGLFKRLLNKLKGGL
jgi:hypothetical protein